jgi:hypothetical protein
VTASSAEARSAPRPLLWLPSWALDGVMYSLSPALLSPTGGTLRLTPTVLSNRHGPLSAEDIAAAVADMSEAASSERWTDGARAGVSDRRRTSGSPTLGPTVRQEDPWTPNLSSSATATASP